MLALHVQDLIQHTSTTWLLCLLYTGRFVVAVVVYFVAGMIIMRVKFEKTGTDVIPNKEFWFALPFLVKVSIVYCGIFKC